MPGNPETIGWVILFLPLIAAAGIALFTRRNGPLSAKISIGAIVISFLLSVVCLVFLTQTEALRTGVPWITVAGFNVNIGVQIDRLSLLMLLIVTGVGSLIHIYSYEYMREDPGMSRYFACLSLFTFSMLGIVVSDNFVEMFIFWELVGVSSYLLIGFWFERPAAADAGKKAFLTNRLGDFGFLLGIILFSAIMGSVRFDVLAHRLELNPAALGKWGSVAGLLIFCGAVGKSAQFPLHVWLPDAMEGPTPVSALIHAATMVAAGVYMLCRCFFVFSATPAWPAALSWLGRISALDIVSWIGGATALLAAVIAVQQNDIKRILAYSTLSQLGYMVMAVGLHSPSAAMYHLTTHAFFKALLFLGAGSVIYALHHEQDIWRMGGLKSRMPLTFWTFVIGTLALCGVPPFSGFFSKDEILSAAYHHNVALFVVATLVAILTTFYMFRLLFVAFLGPSKSDAVAHAHESPAVMTTPLVVLAIPTLIAGFWGLNGMLEHKFGVAAGHLAGSILDEAFAPFNHSPLAAFAGIGAVLFGLFAAYGLYWNATEDPLPQKFGFLSSLMQNRFYFDEIYSIFLIKTHDALAGVAGAFDRWIISGLCVRGLHGTIEITGRALRLLQTGNLQTYAFLVVAGVAMLLLYLFRH